MSAAYPLKLCVRGAGSRSFSSLHIRPSTTTTTRKHGNSDSLLRTTDTPNFAAARRWASAKSSRRKAGEGEGAELYDGKRLQHLVDELYEKAGSKPRPDPPSERARSLAESKLAQIGAEFNSADRIAGKYKMGSYEFWNEHQDDPDFISETLLNDEFNEDDILSGAHGKLEEHREMREYARLTIWDMPLLSKFAKPFEVPTRATPLRWRYTTYMGEFHPAEKKVVVEFCPEDFGLTEVQASKLKKLAGARYNPEKGTVKMSCENFEHPAQNKRYLGDVVMKLIAEAKDPKDTFEDIPLDTRHHNSKLKVKPKFPKEWRMTEDRRAQLSQLRHQAYLLDQGKKPNAALADGSQLAAKALKSAAEGANGGEKLEQLVRVGQTPSAGNRPVAR